MQHAEVGHVAFVMQSQLNHDDALSRFRRDVRDQLLTTSRAIAPGLITVQRDGDVAIPLRY